MIFLFQTHHSQSICLSGLTRESPHQVRQFRVKWLKELKVSLPWLTPGHTQAFIPWSLWLFCSLCHHQVKAVLPSGTQRQRACCGRWHWPSISEWGQNMSAPFQAQYCSVFVFSNELLQSCDRPYKRSSWPHSGYLTKCLYIYMYYIYRYSCE